MATLFPQTPRTRKLSMRRASSFGPTTGQTFRMKSKTMQAKRLVYPPGAVFLQPTIWRSICLGNDCLFQLPWVLGFPSAEDSQSAMGFQLYLLTFSGQCLRTPDQQYIRRRVY